MNMRYLSSVPSICWAIFCCAGLANADLVIYEISGVLPPGASNHSQISDGESWLATFIVDTSVPDSDPGNVNAGIYMSSAVAGVIEFSGGFSQALEPLDILIGDDSNSSVSGTFNDSVLIVDDYPNPNIAYAFQVVQESSTEPNPLFSSDALPGVGTSFSHLQFSSAAYVMLIFTDSITGEQVFQGSLAGPNTSFNARAIPEPTSAIGLGYLAITAVGLRRRRTEIAV